MTSLSNGFVCVMGMGTVFICLACIVFLCLAISGVVRMFAKDTKTTAPQAPASAPAPALAPAEKSAIIAGVCACIAEELGTDASNIKVVSFKRV